MIEVPLLLSMLIRAYRVEPVEGRPAMPVAHLTVRGRDGIWLRVTPRGRAPEDSAARPGAPACDPVRLAREECLFSRRADGHTGP